MNSSHYYVLDSNVLLHDMHAIQSFNRPQQHIIIPIYVIEELDSFKEELSERGQCARHVTRWLDQQRSLGSLATGISLEQGGYLRVTHTHSQLSSHMTTLQSAHTSHMSHLYYDELILRCALDLLGDGCKTWSCSGKIDMWNDLSAAAQQVADATAAYGNPYSEGV